MSDEAKIKMQLKEWIVACKSGAKLEDITDDTALITHKFISSVQVLDLILHLESLGAKSLDPSKLSPQSFQSITSIYQNFFA